MLGLAPWPLRALRFIADQSRARCGEGGLIGLVVIGRHEFGDRPVGAKQKEEGGERDADGRHQDGQLLAERGVLDVKLTRPLVSFKDRQYKVKKMQRKPGRRQSSRSTASHAPRTCIVAHSCSALSARDGRQEARHDVLVLKCASAHPCPSRSVSDDPEGCPFPTLAPVCNPALPVLGCAVPNWCQGGGSGCGG